jgi:hypothetical protein
LQIDFAFDGTGTPVTSTSTMPLGKNIIRIKSSGTAYTVEVNNVDWSSQFSAKSGEWEGDFSGVNKVTIPSYNRLSGTIWRYLEIHAVLRCTEDLTGDEVDNMYAYLNAKY